MHNPQAYEAQVNFKKGTAAYVSKNYDKAEKLLKKSIKGFPSCEAWLNLGLTYVAIDRFNEALKAFKNSLQCNPQYAEAWLNIGSTYKTMGRFDEALTAFQTAIQCNPQYAEAWNNVAIIYHLQNNEAKADGFFRKALEIWPDYPDANWNFSLSLLKRACDGEYSLFPEGWKRFESRFLKSGAVTMSARSKGARWVGQEGADKTLLVVFEQGIGDNIMFARYLPYLNSAFKKVYVQCVDEMLYIQCDDLVFVQLYYLHF
jgi:tetratricopeptide (TPR) repeat protein